MCEDDKSMTTSVNSDRHNTSTPFPIQGIPVRASFPGAIAFVVVDEILVGRAVFVIAASVLCVVGIVAAELGAVHSFLWNFQCVC